MTQEDKNSIGKSNEESIASKASKSDEEIAEAESAIEETAVEEKEETEEEKLAKLKKVLEETEAQAAEYLEGWRRAQAEFSNYKKRQEAERGRITVLANANLLRKLFPIIDDFERAMMTLPDNLSQVTWVNGISLIHQKLKAVLDSEGVEPIETEGQMFDPRYHEAITYEETPAYEEGQIIGEVQRGYILGERVLRPALVRVAKAPAAQPEPDLKEKDEGPTENDEYSESENKE